MEACIGYLTTQNKEQARTLANALIEKRLIACANIFDGAESIYRWEGKTEVAQEAVLVVKTTANLRDKIVTIVKALHSYSVPCVVFYAIDGGNADYLKWIADETR